MITFRRLLTFSYLAIALAGIALAAPLAWLSLEQSYLDNQQTNVLAQAQLVAQALQSVTQALPSAPYSGATNALPGIHTHILEAPERDTALAPERPVPGVYIAMFTENGPVVIDLQTAPPLPQQLDVPVPSPAQNASPISSQELLARPEIAEAFSGRPATAIRTIRESQRVLYAAVPIVSTDSVITRIVYIATPLPKSGWAALASATRWQMLGLVILVIIFTAILGWCFSRVLAHSLDQIISAAKHIAAGDLGSRLQAHSAVVELRLLDQAFNEMTESLRQADQAKMAFVADVSHELRTPLTVIKGTVETLQDGALDDLDAREGFLASIARETERLIDLVNGLLTLARADGGALKIQPKPLNLAALVQSRMTHMRPLAARKAMDLHTYIASASNPPIQMEANVAQDSCWVLADAPRITQVVDNLLDNAIRYSRDGDRMHIILTPGAAHVTCSVEDSGPGIPAVHLPFIFNRFYRVDASRNRSLGGSGLGLAICRAIVEAHGGSISIHSLEGHGTTVTFTLPATTNCS